MMRGDMPPRTDYLVKIAGSFAVMVDTSHSHTMHCASPARKPRGHCRSICARVRITLRTLCKDGPAKILRMDFCTQNRFNFRFRIAMPFLQPEHGA
jgi:hypothetical protein